METITINGITYTPADESAELTYDSSGNVTGIASGTVEVTLEDSTDPKITLDGSTPFSFTAEATDGGLKFTQGSNSFSYVSGEVNYSADKINFPAGDIGIKLNDTTLASLFGTITVTIPSSGLEIPIDSEGIVTLNLTEAIIATLSGDNASGSLSLNGDIIYDAANKKVTFAENAVISFEDFKLNENATPMNFELTALAESVLAIDGTNFTFNDGASFSISGSTFGLTGELTLNGGDLSVGLLQLISGQDTSFTLTAGSTLTATLQGLPFEITAPSDAEASISMVDGVLSVTTGSDNEMSLTVAGLSAFPISIEGTVKLDIANNAITLTQDTVAEITLSNGAIAQITANADATSAFAVAEDGTITLTPNANDGTLTIKIENAEFEGDFETELEIVSGSVTFNPSTYHFGFVGGTVMKATMGGFVFTTSNAEDAGGTISFTEDGGLTYTPDTNDGTLTINVEGTSESQFENVAFEVSSGSFTIYPEYIAIAQDTEFKATFSENYFVSFKTTDEAGGMLALVDDGIIFKPGEDGGSLELTVTNGDTVRTSNLEMTGMIKYTFGGNIELAEGTVVTNIFEDGNELTITANTDSSGTISFSPQGGLKITPASEDALSVVLTDGDIDIFNITKITGSFTYSGGIITASNGSEIRFTNYFYDENEMIMSTTGGESSLQISADGITYTADEGATLTQSFGDSITIAISNGSLTADTTGFSVTEGIVITDTNIIRPFTLETAGSYSLNGNEITTTEDGVQVYLTNGDTVTFDADAAIAVEGYSFGGEGTVSFTDGDFTLGAGSTLTKTFESGNVVTITANADLTGCYSPALLTASTETDSKEITINADGSITVAPATADAVSVTYTTSNAAVTYETIDGSITYGEDTVTLADGTESTATRTVGETSIALDFAVEGGSSSATITENDITYALEEGATLTAKINDNTTVLSAGTMRSLLDGSATYLSDGANITADDATYILETAGTYTLNGQEITTEKDNVEVSLSDGAIVFELGDESTLTITPNTENAGEITVDADGGVTVTPSAADSMSVTYTTSNAAVTYETIDGSITYTADTVTLADGTESTATRTVGETSIALDFAVEGGSSSATITENDITYALEEGATLTAKINDNTTVLSAGTMRSLLDGSATYLSNGANITVDFDAVYTLETAGTYTLNGNEITTTADNVEVSLTNGDTVTFDASAGVSYDGNAISGVGEVTITDGEICLVIYEIGSVSYGGQTFNLTEASSDGVTIKPAEDGFTIESVDEDGTFTENYTVAGDDSYTVQLVAGGLLKLQEISDGATVTANSEYAPDVSTGAYIETDSEGKFTFNDKEYEISDDSSVNLHVSFKNDGTASLVSVDDLDGDISGDFNGTTSINGSAVTINDGADNALISAIGESMVVSGVEGGASVTAESASVEVINSMTVNEVTYNVSGDSDGVLVQDKAVYWLDKNASLTVSESGNYTVNSTPLEVTTDDVVVGLNSSFAYILTEEVQIQSTDSTEEILDAFGVDESDAKIIPASATGNQRATIPSGGGVAIVEDTKAPVTIVGGSGDDTVVSKGDDVVFNMVRGGDDKVMALDGNIKIENYNPRTNAGIQLTAEDMQSGVKFNDGTIELANGTVELSNNFVNLYDIAGNKDLIGFATNEDKRVDASSQTEGISIIGGGENASNSVSNATLIGGSGNDSIYAGNAAHIKPGEGNDYIKLNGGNSTIDYGGGNDLISGFNFADSSSADKLQKATITDVDVFAGAVALKTEDGTITIFDAENKDIALDKDVTLQVGDDELKFDGVANQYWATGDNATVKLDETYTSKTVPAIDLTEMKGSVKDVDASSYEGAASITGNSGDNVITASAGGSTLDGGDGNDSLKGGAGVDEFISASGDDTINGFEFGTGETSDKLNAGENAISKVKVDNGNVILTTENGSVEIEDAAGQTVQFKSEKTNNETIAAQFADTAVTLNDEANFYWAGGNSATVDVDSELDTKTKLTADLSNTDYNNASKLSFAGDIKEINASGFDGAADLSGNSKNNVITASAGGSTLNGGERNDKLVGGAGADTFVYEQGNGKDTVSNFEFGTEKTSDVIDLTDVAVKSVKVYDDDVILEVDGGFVKVEGGAGETIQIKSEHTNNKAVVAQFAANDLAINDEANFYWAANKNATLTVANYSASTVEIDLSNSDYNNADQLSFAGKIRTVDASSYKGYARITGNDLNNVLIAGNKDSNLWGGAGNDTLIGSDGTDRFIYSDGNDVVQNASKGDLVYLKGLTLDDIKKVDATDSSINLKFKNGGTLSIETDSPEDVAFTYDSTPTTYTYNRETKSFDAHGAGCY